MRLAGSAIGTLLGLSCLAANVSSNGAPGKSFPLPSLASQKPFATTSLDAADNATMILLEALRVMQQTFFQYPPGRWPEAIDWTSAFVSTVLSSSLLTLTGLLPHDTLSGVLSHYVPQLTGHFISEPTASLHLQAYDDMLWVVLSWLSAGALLDHLPANLTPWAIVWRRPFALRAREFYFSAERGWDDKLCAGGMNWNPKLEPYKNAITNELFLSASAAMYASATAPGAPVKNRTELLNALKTHAWLHSLPFQSDKFGLYVDGFHISERDLGGITCDARNNDIYTYNQGVILSGLRILWEATEDVSWLNEGHALISRVLASEKSPLSEGLERGVVRNQTLEEECDPDGVCSQDGQMFKGIWFHHFTEFCKLPPVPNPIANIEHLMDGPFPRPALPKEHVDKCKGYYEFVKQNALAALGTRNETGIMGGWWASEAATEHNPVPAIQGAHHQTYLGPLTDGSFDRSMLSKQEFQRLSDERKDIIREGDLNDRGRGRTIETHAGGVSALRALVEWNRLLASTDAK